MHAPGLMPTTLLCPLVPSSPQMMERLGNMPTHMISGGTFAHNFYEPDGSLRRRELAPISIERLLMDKHGLHADEVGGRATEMGCACWGAREQRRGSAAVCGWEGGEGTLECRLVDSRGSSQTRWVGSWCGMQAGASRAHDSSASSACCCCTGHPPTHLSSRLTPCRRPPACAPPCCLLPSHPRGSPRHCSPAAGRRPA